MVNIITYNFVFNEKFVFMGNKKHVFCV